VNKTDPTGKIADTVLDIGFIVYDMGMLAYDEIANDGENRTENLAALGADVIATTVPFATGGGLAVRGGVKAEKILSKEKLTISSAPAPDGKKLPDVPPLEAGHKKIRDRQQKKIMKMVMLEGKKTVAVKEVTGIVAYRENLRLIILVVRGHLKLRSQNHLSHPNHPHRLNSDTESILSYEPKQSKR
jgi:hypothetical protein